VNGVQLAAVVVAILAAAALAATRTRARRFPLAGAAAGRATSAVVVVVLATAVVAAAGSAAVLTARVPQPPAAAPQPARTVIVLDVSGSLSSGAYGLKLARELRLAAADAGATAGFVIFADSAVELLPPSSPAQAVAALARFAAVTRTAARDRLAESSDAPRTYESATPWSDAFIGNTEIASGVDLARRLLMRSRGSPSGGRIVLISDLQDGGLGSTLRRAVMRSREAGIAPVAIPVGSTPSDIAHWRQLGGTVESVRSVRGVEVDARADRTPDDAPIWPAVAAACFAVLLAALYLWSSPFRLPGPPHVRKGSTA